MVEEGNKLSPNYMGNPNYSPNVMLNRVCELMGIKSDAELARNLRMYRAHICRVRSRQLKVGESMLLRLHDLTGVPAKELRKWMGVEQ